MQEVFTTINKLISYIQAKYGPGLEYLKDYEQVIRSLTNADVQAMAKKVLGDNNLVKVVMRPAKEKAE